MESKTLSRLQAVSICLALLGLYPSTRIPGGSDSDPAIEIHRIRPTASVGMLGVEVDFKINVDNSPRYNLLVIYRDVVNDRNPAIISLARFGVALNGEETKEIESLANLSTVVSWLTKWGFWERVD